LRSTNPRGASARRLRISGLNAALLLVTWPQLLVGGGGIALIIVGIAYGLVVSGYADWRHEPPAALGYAGVMVMAAIAGGACFLAAAALRSHFWEVTGVIILVASYAGRMVLARWLRRRYPNE
jgi:hypothetical protein